MTLPITNDETEKHGANVVSISASELTDAQRIAITKLCEGSLPHEAAKAAGVNRRTLQLWRKKAAFNVELTKAQQQTIQTRNGDAAPAPANSPASPRPKIKGPITLEKIDDEAMRTILERIQLGDGKVALEFAKARGLLKPPEEESSDEPITVQFGELPKAEAELEEVLKETPPPVILEPTYKPTIRGA